MPVVTPAVLTALMTGYRREFQAAYDAAHEDSFYRAVASVVPSATKSNTYGWLKDFPSLREWIGARVVKDMAAGSYVIENKDWESTVGIKRTDIEDDNLGLYGPMIGFMGDAAARKPDELIAALMAAGESTLCFDGQNFFDTDHPVAPNEDGTGTAVSVSNYDSGGGSPGDAWYLLDCSKPLKPFIYQNRKAPEFVAKTDPRTSDNVFTNNTFEMGVDMRSNVGFGFWQMAYKSKSPLNKANYEAARAALRGFTADGGRPLGIKPTHLVVPGTLEAAAKDVIKRMLIGGGDTNPNYDDVEVVVTSWLG
ncbi:MAG: Mu-like prophage major head subunit gpT family protein [Pseudomonadota bacterium]